MTYGEVYDYLKSKGCTFTFDNPKSFQFSDTHVFYDGKEIGKLCMHAMYFNKDSMVHSFNYESVWMSMNKFEFINFLDKIIYNIE